MKQFGRRSGKEQDGNRFYGYAIDTDDLRPGATLVTSNTAEFKRIAELKAADRTMWA